MFGFNDNITSVGERLRFRKDGEWQGWWGHVPRKFGYAVQWVGDNIPGSEPVTEWVRTLDEAKDLLRNRYENTARWATLLPPLVMNFQENMTTILEEPGEKWMLETPGIDRLSTEMLVWKAPWEMKYYPPAAVGADYRMTLGPRGGVKVERL